jgi:hypothetical protein
MANFQLPSSATKAANGSVKPSAVSRSSVHKNSQSVAAKTTTPVTDKKQPSGKNLQKKSRLENINNVQPHPQSSTDSGKKIPNSIREALEKSLQVDLETVRVHQDAAARRAAGAMSARAFTYGSDIFLGPGEKDTDLALMGHEAAHVIQQQNVSSVQQLSSTGASSVYEREAHAASQAVVQGRSFSVQSRVSSPSVQKLSLSDVLGGIADLAAALPGFTLLTFIIGFNPITLDKVERNVSNLLHAFLGLLGPLGEGLFQILQKYEIIEKVANWLNKQVAGLGITFNDLKQRFVKFTDSLSWKDIFKVDQVWERGKKIFNEPIQKCNNFCSKLIDQAITWLKETFTQPVKDFCSQIPGYKLITVLLGRDPFTSEPVPMTAMNVVMAFAEFIPGGTERVQQLVESKSLQKVYEWFMAETKARNLTWDRIKGTFIEVWNSLKIENVLQPIETFKRISSIGKPLMIDLVGFAKASLMKILEIMFEIVMSSGGTRILAILKKGRDAFLMIIRDPVSFLKNLLGAVGQGIKQFMSKILVHLKEGVIAWLVGPVAKAGIQMPEQWDLKGIIWFVLQILGISWDKIREKLTKLLGPGIVEMLEKGFALVQEIREKGIVQALKDRAAEFFGQLKESALGSIKSFIQERLVMAGITQLLSMLSPVGAVIQSIIKTYTTIKFFIDKINQMLEFVESIVNSIASIAAGAIGAAANFIEKTMAKTIPLILDFLARFIGLGNVGEHVQKTIKKLQGGVDGMLDKAVDWIKTMAKNVASKALGGDPMAPPRVRVENACKEAQLLVKKYAGKKVGGRVLCILLAPLKIKYNLTQLDIIPENGQWAVLAAVNPKLKVGIPVKVDDEKETITIDNNGIVTETRNAVTGRDAQKNKYKITPVTTYKTDDLCIPNGPSCKAGVSMVADPLSPEHKAGSSPGSKHDAIFKYLPTSPKAEDKKAKSQLKTDKNKVYIRGHLLNDNLGGFGEDYNMFPITGKANGEHVEKMESKVKTAVNDKGLFAYYSVSITKGKIEEITGLKYKAVQMYKVQSKIECEFDTYIFEKNESKRKSNPLKRKGNPIKVTITSEYDDNNAPKTDNSPKKEAELMNNAVEMDNFVADNVKLSPRQNRMKELDIKPEARKFFDQFSTPKELENVIIKRLEKNNLDIAAVRTELIKSLTKWILNKQRKKPKHKTEWARIVNKINSLDW